MAHVLIVDDELNIRRVLAAMLKRDGYEVTAAADGEQALAAMARTPIQVVVTDLVMPRLDGLALLRRVGADYPDVPVIVITAHGTVDSAVAALKAGAFNYITKPFEQEELKKVIAKAARAHDLERQNVHGPSGDGEKPPLVGQSQAMRHLYEVIGKVTDPPSTVLVTGESGTGKELVAQALHRGSSRRDKPLIKVNCAAIPKDLVESELLHFYFANLADGGVWLWRSTDDCRSFQRVGPVHEGSSDDKEMMAVDNDASSPFFGRLYVVWTDFGAGGIAAAASGDGGEAWSSPVRVSPPNMSVQGAWPVVASGGELFVAWTRFASGRVSIHAARSSDGGRSFTQLAPVAVDRVRPGFNVGQVDARTLRGAVVRLGSAGLNQCVQRAGANLVTVL